MKQCILIGSIFLALAGAALAHTGPDLDVEISSLSPQSWEHTDMAPYKGWWTISLTNNTGVNWTQLVITPGAGNQVAIVVGEDLEDDLGFAGDSIISTKAGSWTYGNNLGTRTYTTSVPPGTTTGTLYDQATLTLTNALPSGLGSPQSKISLKIYTDNSYYGSPDPVYSMTITPVAVPEPATLGILGGLSLLGLLRRKSR